MVMNRTLDIELWGPCSEESEAKPALGDTVAVIRESGRVSLLSITGVNTVGDQTVLYATGGEKLVLTDCYLLYTSDLTAAVIKS